MTFIAAKINQTSLIQSVNFYESALDRMARELAAVEKIDKDKAMEKLAESLAKKKAVAA